MPNRLTSQQLAAELSSVEQLLATLPPDDVLGRLGLESRKREISAELEGLAQPENLASVALMFGGSPVIGSIGIESNFASEIVSQFQTLVSNVWASEQGQVGRRGPVERRDESLLHITSLLHGSVGFLLEEVEAQERLLPSPLKQASERAVQIVEAFVQDDDSLFETVLEDVDNRVLGSTRDFLRKLRNSSATVRVVEGDIELDLDSSAVEHAYERAESATIEDVEQTLTGELLGLIPYGRKFEVLLPNGEVVSGSVAPNLSESYLRRLEEQLVGQPCEIKIHRKKITRFGRATEKVMLLDIQPVRPQGGDEPR